MKTINEWMGLLVAVFLLGFAYVWIFEPEKKQEIQDRWYRMTIECDELQREVSLHQRCTTSEDCELARKESIRAEKAKAQYNRYCSRI